jgi:hypothetical protein
VTVLYLYGISDSPSRPDITGLQGAPLAGDGRQGLFAIWSEHDGQPFDPDETALWDHERVVEALLGEGTVLPMRFGSWLPDRNAVLDLLEQRRSEFERGLDRVRGAVEIGVRALVHGEQAEPAPALAGADRPGTAYMLARLGEEKRSAAIALHIHEPLVALSRASVTRTKSLSESVNTAYLVARDDVAPFRATVEKLDDTLEEATIVCTGPWPPYSFTPSESTR